MSDTSILEKHPPGEVAAPACVSGAMVRADEIPWTLDAEAVPESVDVLGLDDSETLTSCQQLQRETYWLRRTLHDALTQLREFTVQGDYYESRIRALIGELRLARDETRALRAQLRASEDHAA